MTALLAYCTCPDSDTASRIARTLVEERLAACVNAIGDVASTYRWDGIVQSSSEVLLLIKTRRDRWDALSARLPDLHPYDTPELIAVDVVAGLPAYLRWIDAESTPE